MTFTNFKIHLFGVIPGKYFDLQMCLADGCTLEYIERKIVELYRSSIPKQYITSDEMLDHNCMAVVDKKGRHLNVYQDLKDSEEIWFLIPIAGG